MQGGGRRARQLLIRLMTEDDAVASMTAEELVSTLSAAKGRVRLEEGRVAVTLHDDHGWTWERIGTAFGVNQSTVHRWAARYRQHRDQT